MIGTDEIEARREELVARRDALMERASEIRERFAEIDEDMVTTAVGWTLVSGGIAFALTQWLRGRRGLFALLLPAGALAAGVALLTGGFARRRGRRIGEVEDEIRAQLAGLDPVARMQVLGTVGRDTAPFLKRSED